jgi:hypothetical protein
VQVALGRTARIVARHAAPQIVVFEQTEMRIDLPLPPGDHVRRDPIVPRKLPLPVRFMLSVPSLASTDIAP